LFLKQDWNSMADRPTENKYDYGSHQYTGYKTGWEAGREDLDAGAPEQLRYVPESTSQSPGAWPFPT
jgi:hypothetical protein